MQHEVFWSSSPFELGPVRLQDLCHLVTNSTTYSTWCCQSKSQLVSARPSEPSLTSAGACLNPSEVCLNPHETFTPIRTRFSRQLDLFQPVPAGFGRGGRLRLSDVGALRTRLLGVELLAALGTLEGGVHLEGRRIQVWQ